MLVRRMVLHESKIAGQARKSPGERLVTDVVSYRKLALALAVDVWTRANRFLLVALQGQSTGPLKQTLISRA